MSEVYTSEVFARCLECDDPIRLGDEITEYAGELFHAECV